MVHIFVHVIRSVHDPFLGIKKALHVEGDARLIELTFDEAELDLIDHVEYSQRRFFRFLYYSGIFRSLERKLNDAFADAGNEPVTIYFADEGVWAAFWSEYRTRKNRTDLKAVNVQHGIALLRLAGFQGVRRLVNAVGRLIFGHPVIGYGSLGGIGPHAFDLYLTYDTGTARFISDHAGCLAMPAPRLIKHQLIETYFDTPRSTPDKCYFLFAMNVNMKGSPVKCDAVQTFDELLPLAKTISELGACLIVRLHPGMDQGQETRRFRAHPISGFAEIDTSASQQEALAKSTVAMSFVSTVLWEASLLGLKPVQVTCRCCTYVELPYEREILPLDESMPSRLADLIARARRSEDADWRELEALEWSHLRPQLVN